MKIDCRTNNSPYEVVGYSGVTTPHYTGTTGKDTIDYLADQFTEEQFLGFMQGNIIKYATRLGRKDAAIKELVKIKDYTERTIKYLEDKQ